MKMCNFFSAVLTKNELYYDIDLDSHEDIIKKFNLKDTHEVRGVTREVLIVRLELLPADGDICNHDLSNWKLKVDQDIRPDWFDEKEAERQMKRAVQVVFKERFAINCEIKEIKEGNWRAIKNSVVNRVDGGVVKWVSGGVVNRVSGGVVNRVDGGVVNRVSGGVVEWVSGGVVEWVSGGVVCNYIASSGAIKKTDTNGSFVIISRINNGLRVFTPCKNAVLVNSLGELNK